MKRKIRWASVAAVAVYVIVQLGGSGCATIHDWIDTIPASTNSIPAEATNSVPAVKVDQRLGYGLVNNWSAQDPDAYLDTLANSGVGIVPYEFLEWTSKKAWEDIDGQLAKFARHIPVAKKNGQILWVTLYNGNMGSGKYGDPKVKPEQIDAQIMKAAKQFAAWMKEYPFIVLTPVGEGGSYWDSYDRKIQNWCKANMPVAQLNNNFPARPTGNDGMGSRSWHPCSTSDKGNGNAWVLTDCGTIISQLNGGELYGGYKIAKTGASSPKFLNPCPCKTAAPVKAKTATEQAGITAQYVASVYALGRTVVLYHFDKDAKIDATALRAISALAVQSAPTPDPAEPSGAILPAQVTWLGQNYASAKTTVELSGVSISGNHLNFKSSAVNWPAQGEKKCKAVGFLIRKIDEKYRGGKVEWCVVERGWYDIKTNVEDGYNGSTMPASGETVWVGLGHPVNGSECSTLLPVTWK